MIPDYTSVFGQKEGLVVRTLIEERPKWVVLLLQLRKSGTMSVSEVKNAVKLSYRSLKTAVYYLGGVNLGKGASATTVPHITPLGVSPIVSVIRIPGNKKYVTLTDYGEKFTARIVNYLKDVALRLGAVDVESEYGIPRVTLMSELSSKFPNVDQGMLMSRFVSFESLAVALARTRPSLLAVMRPDLIDAIPVELEIAVDRRTTKRLLLYLLL